LGHFSPQGVVFKATLALSFYPALFCEPQVQPGVCEQPGPRE
jgi:hypothetical protein